MAGSHFSLRSPNRIDRFQPRDLPGCALWSSPFNNKGPYSGASFPGGDNANYLSVADHADFDVSAGKFTVELWNSPSGNLVSDADMLVRTFIGQNAIAANSGGWGIASGGNLLTNNVRVLLSTNSGGTTAASAEAPNTNGWSHLLMVYDGSLAAALRCAVYLDGALVDPGTYTITGTLPATLQNPSAIPLAIGREYQTSANDAKDVMGYVRFWPTTALTAGNAATLYNSGTPLTYADLGALQTGCKGAWLENPSDLTEDASGNGHALTATGTVTSVGMTLSTREKGVNSLTLRPVRYSAAADYSVLAYSAAPRWESAGLNGRPCFRFQQNQNLYAASSQWNDNLTADFFDVFELVNDPATETFFQLAADELTTNFYFMTGLTPDLGSLKPVLRIKAIGQPVGDNHVYADFDCQPNTPYLINWRCLGTGDAASFECRVNGVAVGTLNFGDTNVYNKGPASVLNRDNLCLLGLARTTGPSVGPADVRMGEQAAFGPGLSTARNRFVERWLANRADITLA